MTRSRSLALAAGVGALSVFGALAVPLAASAAPGDDVLIFSNGSVVDTTAGSELAMITAAITAGGFDATQFDGGDGSLSAWQAALTDIEAFVLPEQERGNVYDPVSPPSWMSEDAFDAVIDWVRAGGTMLISGTCRYDQGGSLYFINEAVGVDYTDTLGDCQEVGEATRWISDTDLPASLPYANGNYTLDLGDFSAAQLAPLTVWYSGTYCGQEQLSIGEFAAGDGRIAFDAWDYFPDESAYQADWNEVLVSLLDGNSAPSTWDPDASADGPEPGSVTATTESGDALYSINNEWCGDDTRVYQIDPETAFAAPTSGATTPGWAYQGAWNPIAEIGYLPYYSDTVDGLVLATVDPVSGEIAILDEFTWTDPDIMSIDTMYGLAIGSDGSAYVFAQADDGDTAWMVLFSVNLETAELTVIKEYGEEDLNEPNGFAVNPVDGAFYAIEEDDVDDVAFELFRVDVETGDLTSLGLIESPSIESSSDSNALQVGSDGTFWFSFDIYDPATDDDVSVLASFALGEMSGGVVVAHEAGVLTDEAMWTGSLLIVPADELAATGPVVEVPLGVATFLMLIGAGLMTARLMRRRVA